ncbi:DUF3265 domain-containing protein [Vibrio cholerae]|nr:DUF3265 domain-containing protein [Vibrio cholerae]TXX56674.1 DUF3265 domain-containing protein [Vibrio cholerae]
MCCQEKVTHNKAFKRDSCRVAFLFCSGFGGENGLRKAGLCGTHPLTRRYVYRRSSWLIGLVF